MERLIPLRKYVLRFDKPIGFYADQLDYYEGQSNAMSYVISYAKFLSQKLELWMFVPCKLMNGVWGVFEEPRIHFSYMPDPEHEKRVKKYQEAKDRVLFKGFESCVEKDKAITNYKGEIILLHNNNCFSLHGKQITAIEDLVKYNLELTPTAQKQIGL